MLDRTTRTKRDTKRQNLLTLLILKFRRVHNSLSFWHLYSESLCLFSKFAISCSSISLPKVPWEMQCVLSHPIPWDIFRGIPMGKPDYWYYYYIHIFIKHDCFIIITLPLGHHCIIITLSFRPPVLFNTDWATLIASFDILLSKTA